MIFHFGVKGEKKGSRSKRKKSVIFSDEIFGKIQISEIFLRNNNFSYKMLTKR